MFISIATTSVTGLCAHWPPGPVSSPRGLDLGHAVGRQSDSGCAALVLTRGVRDPPDHLFGEPIGILTVVEMVVVLAANLTGRIRPDAGADRRGGPAHRDPG